MTPSPEETIAEQLEEAGYNTERSNGLLAIYRKPPTLFTTIPPTYHSRWPKGKWIADISFLEQNHLIVLTANKLTRQPQKQQIHLSDPKCTQLILKQLNSYFPGLLQDKDHTPESLQRLDDIISEELKEAGILPESLGELRQPGQIPTKYLGTLHGWSFKRTCGYYIAKGPGIPPHIATKLHENYGKVARVDGHCGCPSPLEWFEGFAVGHYHVDTQDGLNALAETIRYTYSNKETLCGMSSPPSPISSSEPSSQDSSEPTPPNQLNEAPSSTS